MRLEAFMRASDGMDYGDNASPAQRALWRIADGLPLAELVDHPDVLTLCGGADAVASLPNCRPEQVNIQAAIRSGKTDTEIGHAICSSQTVNVDHLKIGEEPVYPLVSLTEKHAKITLGKLIATIQAKPKLRRLLIGDPAGGDVVLRHPSGRPMRIRVSVLSEAGGAVQSVWLFGLGVDEYPRQPHGGIVRIQDLITSARGRLLSGAQILGIGSPWAMAGPAYEEFKEHFGKPSSSLVVLNGTGPMLNRSWWTPERCEKLRKKDPRAYRADVLGEFVTVESSAFDLDDVEAAMAAEVKGDDFTPIIAIDPAFRSDEFGYCVIGFRLPDPPDRWLWGHAYDKNGNITARDCYQLRDADGQLIRNPDYDKPRRPVMVVHQAGTLPRAGFAESWAAVAQIARRWRTRIVVSDHHQADASTSEAPRHGLKFKFWQWGPQNKGRGIEHLQSLLRAREIVLPKNTKLLGEFASYVQRFNAGGSVSYEAARGHDDVISSLICACIADLEGEIPNSPTRCERGRIDYGDADSVFG